MKAAFKPRLDILPQAQRRLWPELAPAAKLGFVLYGGTAIALRLGHRRSVDFDFFSDAPLDRAAITASFVFMPQATVLQDERNAFTVLVPYGDSDRDHVKVSFFGAIGFGRVGEPEVTEAYAHESCRRGPRPTRCRHLLQAARSLVRAFYG